jgi:hypothetical protein
LVNEIKLKNTVIEAHNEEVKKIKEKVKIVYRSHAWSHNNECAIIKIDNWRDPLPEEEEDREDKKEDAKHNNSSFLNKSKSHHSHQSTS